MVKNKKRKNGDKRNIYNGYRFASKLEVDVAKLLDQYSIPFEPHAKFKVEGINGDGEPKKRQVDFLLGQLIKVCGADFFISVIEVKGVIKPRDLERKRLLEQVGIPTFIATPAHIAYWKKYGFVEGVIVVRIQPNRQYGQIGSHFRQSNRRIEIRENEELN